MRRSTLKGTDQDGIEGSHTIPSHLLHCKRVGQPSWSKLTLIESFFGPERPFDSWCGLRLLSFWTSRRHPCSFWTGAGGK